MLTQFTPASWWSAMPLPEPSGTAPLLGISTLLCATAVGTLCLLR